MTPVGRTWLVAAVVVLAAGACTGSGGADCDPLPGVRAGLCLTAPEDREPAPDDPAPVLGVDDETISLADLRGQVVIVNFWASWCGPCRAEQPVLNEARAALPDDEVAFLGVDLQDSEANGLAHAEEFGIPYPSIADPASRYAASFGGVGPRSIPTTILVDRAGRVAGRIFGEVTDPTELVVLASSLLEETAPGQTGT